MALNGSRRRPLVLVYEDLHWVDTLTEELLATLADNLQGAAILLLCTYRPGYRAPWLGLSYARQLSLQPLSPTESADVIRGALGGEELPERLAQVAVERAEGNPFFAQELARAFRDGHEEGAATGVPGTVRDVLAARIDLLPDPPRRLLRTASVIGREFSLRLLEPLWDEGSSLEPHLGPSSSALSSSTSGSAPTGPDTSSPTPSPTRSPMRASWSAGAAPCTRRSGRCSSASTRAGSTRSSTSSPATTRGPSAATRPSST